MLMMRRSKMAKSKKLAKAKKVEKKQTLCTGNHIPQ
jgi:hypothetical protein